ncbi:MAG TPA: phosphoribosylanthranilate isomerase [Tepidisphaeraceae bacterium]|nr:phosphoribosylanthranilate isomerase [Tepidisphaeraceae bacterium]
MAKVRIKFCGMTRVEDALAAAEIGADAIGMVLHANSPRKIDLETAKQILLALPPFVTPVGLFVNASAMTMIQIIEELGIRHVQLHGDEPPVAAESLSRSVVIKAVRVSPKTLKDDLKTWRAVKNLRGVLLETANTKQPGGSGVVNDWETIRQHQLAGDFDGLPIIAAGGLASENVGDVVRLLKPWAVDVSSGIESGPGIKSREKMDQFVQQVRNAELSIAS